MGTGFKERSVPEPTICKVLKQHAVAYRRKDQLNMLSIDDWFSESTLFLPKLIHLSLEFLVHAHRVKLF